MDLQKEVGLLRRRLEREINSRKQAEAILEQKALELYHANRELRSLNEDLEHKIAERAGVLLSTQLRLTSLISNLQSAVLVEDEKRRIVLVNERFCQYFGIPAPPEVLVGTDCSQSAEQSKHLFSEPEKFVSDIANLLERREICSNEELLLADGRVFERDYIPIFAGGDYLGHLWQYRDVTAARHAADLLRSSEEKYRGIIENMELGLMEVDPRGIIVHAYQRFCQMTGYREDELIGQNAAEKLLVPEFLPVMKQQTIDRMLGKAGTYEIQIFKKDGSRIWVLISGAPIFDELGRITGTLGIHYDVSRQKQLQADLEQARHTAEAAQEAEKQFLANMSHEIRTPLNAVIGMAHLLFDTHPTPEQKDYLSVLKNAAEMLRMLISDVLDLSKIRAGRLEVQQNEFDLRGVLRSVVKSLQLRLEDKPVTTSLDLDPALENLVIGDELLVNQILHNLIGNAEKFTERGSIHVSLKIVEKLPENGRFVAQICVSDTGIGIPKEKQAIIFQAFRQVDGDIRRRFGGTGLGLAIVKQLVEMLGGSISVESEPGRGTTFCVRLPYTDTGKTAESESAVFPGSASVFAENQHVLVAEDNYMNRKYAGSLLEKWGIRHSFAHNGIEALDHARRTRFDLILMDIQMPEMDGYEASVAIRSSAKKNEKTPIIALTASALLSKKDKAFEAGMDDYLSKPFTPAQLFDKLQIHLNFGTEKKPGDFPSQNAAPDSSFIIQNSSINAAALEAFYADDPDYACVMFDEFLKNTAPEIANLQAFFNEKNWPALGKLAHRIKPTFGLVGLTDMENLMRDLEKLALDGQDPAGIELKFREIEAAFPAAVAAVRETLQRF